MGIPEDAPVTRDGKHCPACGVDIGIWPVFLAGLPSMIRCPRCKARLRYHKTGNMWLLGAALFAALMVGGFFIADAFQSPHFLAIWGVVLLIAWIPIELFLALFLRNRGTLGCRSGYTPSERKGVL